MSAEKIAIPDRPIEAGSYSWGWVSYGDYDRAGKPSSISVVMFDEPTDPKSMASLQKTLTRPRWRSNLLCYGPAGLAFIAMMANTAQGNGLLGQLSLALAALSGWQIWKYTRALRKLAGAVEVWGDRDLENYIAGRSFLKALGQRGLPEGDLFAYFNLRAQATELKSVISDDED